MIKVRKEENRMKQNEITLEMIKQQVQIWEDYYNENGVYRDDTICLITDDTAIYNPYVSECMRFNVDPVKYYGKQAYENWSRKMTEHIRKNGVK